jgi:hypothetical protein
MLSVVARGIRAMTGREAALGEMKVSREKVRFLRPSGPTSATAADAAGESALEEGDIRGDAAFVAELRRIYDAVAGEPVPARLLGLVMWFKPAT